MPARREKKIGKKGKTVPQVDECSNVSAKIVIDSKPARDYFCAICLRGFKERDELEVHMKTHKELGASIDACRMEAQPAGVF